MFPSQAIRVLARIKGEDFYFKKGAKANQCYSKDFIFNYCILVPERVNAVEFANKAYAQKQSMVYDVDKAVIHEGFVIEDEEMLDWSPESEEL